MSTPRQWFGLILLPLVVLALHFSLPQATVGVAVTPDLSPISTTAHSTGWAETFYVQNTGTVTTTYNLSCVAVGQITCVSVDQSQVTVGAGNQVDVEVTFSTGNVSSPGTNRVKLVASGSGAVDTGSYRVTVSTSVIRVVSPGDDTISTGRIVVHNRQPVIRALFLNSAGYSTDTAYTVLKWRDTVVTSLARQNRGLLEWEVDSTRWLGLGDSARITVQQTANGITTTETRWAVLLNDSLPVLGFAGMPLEALNGGFSSSFGPGFGVTGAEVETGFRAIPYQSMGVARSAGLVYSTRTSYPRALINADVEIPWPSGTPTSVKVYLWDGAVKMDSVVLSSPSLTPCTQGSFKRCRVSLQADFSGSGVTTPTRKWLKVETVVTSGSVKSALDSVEVVLVDRRTTQYGSGWWPSGISRLYQLGGDRVLIGPAGTATIFRGNGDSLYLSPPGSVTTLIKTSSGWELRPRGSNARVRFDSNGRLIASADANGNKDSVTYTAGTADTVTSFIDPVGKTITFHYTGGKVDQITTLTGGAARTLYINIDGANQLTYYRLPYTASSNTANRDTVRFLYKSYGGTSTFAITTHIGLIIDTTRVVYDSTSHLRPMLVYLPKVVDETGTGVTPDIEYTPYELQGYHTLRSLDSVYVEIKDPRNNWTRSILNRWAQARRTWDAIDSIGRAQYDPDGFVLWSQDKNDSSRSYTVYDSYKRVVKSYIIRAVGDTLRGDSLVYDTNHRVIKLVHNISGQSDSLGYDGNGNVALHKDADGNITNYYYIAGLLDHIVEPGTTAYTENLYDTAYNLQQVEQVGTVDSTVVLAAYTRDQYGRDSVTDSKIVVQVSGGVTKWQWRRIITYYSPLNQVDSTVIIRTDPCNNPCTTPSWPSVSDTTRTVHTRFRRDRGGRDSLRINDRGIATRYLNDRLGRVLARYPWTDSADVRDSMVYDVAGNLRKTITRRGHTIQSYYDSRNRDTLTNIPGIGDRKQVFGGPQDQLTRVFVSNDADSIGGVKRDVSWVFDPHGRLISDTSYTGSTAQGTTYTYDQYERLHTSTDPVGIWRTEYNIKFGGLPRLLVTPFGDSLSYSTDALHRMSGPVVMSSGPNLSFHLAWNDRGRLDSIVQTVSTTPSSFTPLTFFAGTAGDPSLPGVGPSWSEQHGAGATVEGLQDSVTYDGWGRVTAWVAKRAGATVATESYSFDRVGNVRTTGGAEKYDAVTGRLLVRTNGSWTDTLFYDRAGNLDSSKSVNGSARKYRGYDYDALNRLVTVRDSGVRVARYSYDVLGRRIAKRVYSSRSGGDTVYTRFVYHGSNVAFEMDSTNAMRRRYTWGLGTDNLVGVRDSAGGVATQYYAVKDKLGSVRGLIKRDGTWKYSERFAPYGARAEWAGDSSLALRYRWTGREYDAETGFYYFRARYYEPIARRFVQEDPIGFGGGSNLYAYVGGAVLETRDPSGLSPGPGFTGDQEWWDQNRWCDDALCFFHGDDGRSSGPWSDGDSDGFDDLSQLVDAVWRRTWQERHEPQVTTVEVGCRPVRHMYGAAGHCAVRLKDPTGRERVAELVQGSDGKNEIITWNANSASASDYIWVPVEIPSGMTAEGFNTAVWNSFLSVTSEMNGQTYHWDGGRNSNHFVFEIITRAGGQVPNIPWIQLFIPGICGGTGLSKGNSCHSGG